MRPWRARAGAPLALLLAGILLAAPGAAQTEGSLPSDPRVIEANSLLGDDARRARVIQLYEEVLREDPEHETARMWLARVLAWDGRYDESLGHYDRFLERPEPPDFAAVERAEVLSWAGRYAEAERAFQEILASHPGHARAARGLARVYRWSGRPVKAVRAYELALDLGDDPEARRELAHLRQQVGRQGESGASVFQDSDDFELYTATLKAGVDLDLATRVLGEASWHLARNGRDLAADDPRADNDESQGGDALLGVQHRFGGGLVARAWLGGRRWAEADPVLLARAELEWTVSEGLALGLDFDYGDLVARAQSIDALFEDVEQATLRAWAWGQLLPQIALYGYLENSFVDGDRRLEPDPDDPGSQRLGSTRFNDRIAGGYSIDWTPLPDLPVHLVWGSSLLHTVENSDLFYDPELELSNDLALRGERRLARWLLLRAEVSGGYGFTDQNGGRSEGFTWSVSGGPTLSFGRFWISADAFRSSSRRDSQYDTWGVNAGAGASF